MLRVFVLGLVLGSATILSAQDGTSQQDDASSNPAFSLRPLAVWPPHPSDIERIVLRLNPNSEDSKRHQDANGKSFYGIPSPSHLRPDDVFVITDIQYNPGSVDGVQLVMHTPSYFGDQSNPDINMPARPEKLDRDVLMTMKARQQSAQNPRKLPHSDRFTTGIVVHKGGVLDLMITDHLETSFSDQTPTEVVIHGYYYRGEPVFSASQVWEKIQKLEPDLSDGDLSATLRREFLAPLQDSVPFQRIAHERFDEITSLKKRIKELESSALEAKSSQ